MPVSFLFFRPDLMRRCLTNSSLVRTRNTSNLKSYLARFSYPQHLERTVLSTRILASNSWPIIPCRELLALESTPIMPKYIFDCELIDYSGVSYRLIIALLVGAHRLDVNAS